MWGTAHLLQEQLLPGPLLQYISSGCECFRTQGKHPGFLGGLRHLKAALHKCCTEHAVTRPRAGVADTPV